jgi:hypothetical protein
MIKSTNLSCSTDSVSPNSDGTSHNLLETHMANDLADLHAWRSAQSKDTEPFSKGKQNTNDPAETEEITEGAEDMNIRIRTPSDFSAPMLAFNVLALQRYILQCAQNLTGKYH